MQEIFNHHNIGRSIGIIPIDIADYYIYIYILYYYDRF